MDAEIRGVGLGFEEEDVELRIHALESPFLVRFCQDSGEHFPSVIGPSDFSFQTFSSDDILTGSSPSVTEKMRILIGKLRVYHFFVEKHEDLFRFLSDTQVIRIGACTLSHTLYVQIVWIIVSFFFLLFFSLALHVSNVLPL